MKSLNSQFACGLLALGLGLNGCTDPTATIGPETAPPPATVDTHDGHDHDAHGHASHGPHHGDLIELGNEEFHAEIVHDEIAGTVTIYVLNGEATEQVPIDATEVTINATHDGSPEQFQLMASADTNDPEGKSSRFVSNDPDLASRLDEEGADARLVLTINGNSYRGAVAHDHDHAH